MSLEPIPNVQLPLFVYGEPAAEDMAELLPVVWNATQALISPDGDTRQRGLDAVLELGAQRASPLVAYLITTCLCDPDLHIRRRAIYIVADLTMVEPGGMPAHEEIRKVIISYLQNATEKIVYKLLEVALVDPYSEQSIFQILNLCPLAGKYLGEILADGKNPLPVRHKAIHFVGWVGYIEALPILKRLLDRMETRQSQQYAMSFASQIHQPDDGIMAALRIAINRLTAG
jgi:hypothetical protein